MIRKIFISLSVQCTPTSDSNLKPKTTLSMFILGGHLNLYLIVINHKVVSFSLSVAKDPTNRQTDMVILYNVASYMSWKGLQLFRGRVSPP